MILGKQWFVAVALFCFTGVLSCGAYAEDAIPKPPENKTLVLEAGILQKELRSEGTNLHSDAVTVAGVPFKNNDNFELSLRITKASPNQKPSGLTEEEAGEIKNWATTNNTTDALGVSSTGAVDDGNVQWVEPVVLRSDRWDAIFQKANVVISNPKQGVKRYNFRFASLDNATFSDLTINLVYEVYEGHSAIRKWVEISNNSPQWLKIDEMMLDGMNLAEAFPVVTDLTPVERGATSSIRSYSNDDFSKGIIAGSEIPSAIRHIFDDGRMSYANDYFEWVLGPTERFVSEPVFHYAFDGQTFETASARSTTLDRTIERPFKSFLHDCVGVKNVDVSQFVPLWCSWTNFMSNVDEKILDEMADLAAKCGFRGLLIDAGWGTSFSNVFAPASIIPDAKKFPDFEKTANGITSRGLALGLWVSCFRHPQFDPDLKAVPDGFSLPKIKRDEGLAMSYNSLWRFYYANNLLRLHDQYGVSYFKQDFTNIKFGDIARSHESRTLKESYLRGLRGLFEAQDRICETSPDINIEMTHEIYWGTPGVPCDIAALKHGHTYHIPPNDYSGAGNRGRRVGDWAKDDNSSPDKLRAGLLNGCFNARNRFYAHRALPLQCIEYYGAATVNFEGSLTPEIQRRQVCSWLMGAPSVYAGDLASLTPENISTYKQAFEIIGRLNEKYAIYRHFQYSGVPTPTDTDWHWWGKLNERSEGAVVVIRGTAGADRQKINIPWVNPDAKYSLHACFADQPLGEFSGAELLSGNLELSLPVLGQEIIEISAKR